jgi:beta-glucanase (GH16 family)
MSASRASRHGGRIAIAAVFSAVLLPSIMSFASSASAAPQAAAPQAAAPQAAAPQAAAPQAAAPAAKAKSSWDTVRTEEFTGSALPTGCEPYGLKYTAGKNAWSKNDVEVSGGLLKLELEKKKTSGQPYVAGAVGCWGNPQKYGRFEIKAKVPTGGGINSSISLFPTKAGKSTVAASAGMELLAGKTQTAYVTNGYGTKAEAIQVPGKYAGAFHTYVIEWAPKHTRMTVDGKEIFYSHKAFTGSRWLGLVVSTGDKLTGVPPKGTTLPAKLQIDRIEVAKYTGVKPTYKAAVTPLTAVTPAAGTPTPKATASSSPAAAAKVPASTEPAPVTALEKTSAPTGPALAGGIWPWLLGGSLIAVFAIASLNYPHYRRNQGSQPGNGRA